MPLYEYVCSECGHLQEMFKSIANRKQPEEEPCTKCGKDGVKMKIGNPPISYGSGTTNIITKTPEGFKDKLREIHKMAGKTSTIDV